MEAQATELAVPRFHHNPVRLIAMNEKTNMELWNSVCVTDPAQVKKITGKPYQGNSPKPYWLIQRATEVFGPCGKGWGVEVKSEGFFRMTDTDVMHSAVVVVWYMLDGQRCVIEQMGQTKACYSGKNGMVLDEDAGKKSVTDGTIKCLSLIGFAGDIFSGRWDDSNYVEWAAEQYAPRMSESSIADHKAAFDAASTPEALKTAGDKAYAIADSMGDEKAKEALAAHYKKCRAKLTKKEPA